MTGHPHADYRVMRTPDLFGDIIGPFYSRLDGGEPMIGLAIGEKHISATGFCHGGVITCLADMQSLPATYVAGIRDRLVPTVNLSVDFISPASLGDWLEMRVEVLKATRRFLFTQALIRTSQGAMIARSSAVFKIGSLPHPDPTIVTGQFEGR
jgi:uncharacterized protein (TIGR00369 family)